MEFETQSVKELLSKIKLEGSVKDIQVSIQKVKAELNFHLLDEPSEQTTKLKNELELLLTKLKNILSQKLRTVPTTEEISRSRVRRRNSKKSFKSLLRSRLTVEQHRIRELTEQARADLQVEGLPKLDVGAMCEHIKQSSAEKRIASLYLVDSIVKNIGSVYINLFEDHVEGILVSTFKHGQKKARDTVVKILREWHRRKLFKKEIRKSIYDQLIRIGKTAPPNQANARPQRQPSRANLSMGSKPILTHQSYAYQPPPQASFNIAATLQQFQYDVQTRPDLRPHLDQIHMKLNMKQDVTRDIIHFQQLVNMPPQTDLHQRVNLSQVLSSLEGHIGKTSKKNKRKRTSDTRTPRDVKKKRREDNGFWFFDRSALKKYHRRSLILLYNVKHQQCHVCGLRVSKESYELHVGKHYAEEKRLKNSTHTRARGWNVKKWALDVSQNEKDKPNAAVPNKQVLVDENFTTCDICKNVLDKIFDEAHNEWFNTGCVYEDGKTLTNRSKPIVHYLCFMKKEQERKEKEAALGGPPALEADTPLSQPQSEQGPSLMDDRESSSEEASSDESESGTEIILFSDNEDEMLNSSLETPPITPVAPLPVSLQRAEIPRIDLVQKSETKQEPMNVKPVKVERLVKKETK